jgi:hypothetical protein
MAKMNNKGRNHNKGRFAGIPISVMNTQDYKDLPYTAKALLFELAYQYRYNNNGDLTVALSVLKKRGWKREATISTAIKKLLEANLITKTRQGYFRNPESRCALYALNWHPINDCRGKDLEVKPTITPPRKFSLEQR